MFTRILVPTDFSAASDAALDYARTLAEKFGASLHLLHVVDNAYLTGDIASEMYAPALTTLHDAILKDVEGRLSTRLPDSDRRRFRGTTHALIGTGARTIIEYAAANRIDLIVMGTHGRSGLAHLLMGSVAERVVRLASCPVLTVRQALAAHPYPMATAERAKTPLLA